jgi:membrane-associated phospholipid phosphatase
MLDPHTFIPSGYLWQYELIRWLQSFLTPEWERIMKGLSLLGVEWFYILVLPIVFWGINKKIGLRLAYVFLCSMYLNAWFKDFVHLARPIGVPGIQSNFVSSATGWSMPSAHTQASMTFWVLISQWVKQKWFWFLALVLVFGIGVSRLFLGLHWPMDVLVGWGLGLLFGLFGWWIGQWWSYRRYAFNIRLTAAVLLPAICLLVNQGNDSTRYAGLLLGISVGAVLEGRWLGTVMEPSIWKRVCAVIVGMAGLVALQYIIKWPNDWVAFSVLRDTFIGLWGTLGAPYVFEKCGLYRRGETD